MYIREDIKEMFKELWELGNSTDQKYLKVHEVAEALGVSQAPFSALAERGKIPFAMGGKTADNNSRRFIIIHKYKFLDWVSGGKLFDTLMNEYEKDLHLCVSQKGAKIHVKKSLF